MAPGRNPRNQKAGKKKSTLSANQMALGAQTAPTEYERQRMQNIMEKNSMFHRLGLGQIKQFVNAMPTMAPPEESDQLYAPGAQDIEQLAVDKATEKDDLLDLDHERSFVLPRYVSTNVGGIATSKRVRAVGEDEVLPPRMTRQRLREQSSADEVDQVPPIGSQDVCVEEGLISSNDHIQSNNDDMTNEGACGSKFRMGRGLDRMSRGLNTKLKVHIAEGNLRPEAPIQAAKLASEAGIILRDHVPIFPHWKHYKEKKNEGLVKNYMGKVASHFTMDTTRKPVRDACTDLLKRGQRNMRYKLKKTYFNGVAADKVQTTSPMETMTDAEWKDLVNYWSTPAHKERCLKAKAGRALVKYGQKTGSQCYTAKLFVAKQKYKDRPPTEIDLFTATHCSSKTGLSEDAKKAIAQMETLVSKPPEGKDPVTPAEAVSQIMPKTTFLHNIGMEPKKIGKGNKQIQELETALEAEKEGAAQVRAQLDNLSNDVQLEKDARRKVEEEHENLKKQMGEMRAFFLSFNGGRFAQMDGQQ